MRAAIADWTETLKVRSKYSIAYYNRACAYSELGNSEEAIKDFSQAIDINSGWGEGINLASAYAKRALLYRAKGFTQEAEQDIQSFVLNTKPEGEEIFDNEEAETDSQKVM